RPRASKKAVRRIQRLGIRSHGRRGVSNVFFRANQFKTSSHAYRSCGRYVRITNVMQKMAFDETNFVTAYVMFTIGTFIGALLLLVRRAWRERIFRHSEEASPRSKFFYFVNRFVNGVGSFLIFFAISRAHPAMVS